MKTLRQHYSDESRIIRMTRNTDGTMNIGTCLPIEEGGQYILHNKHVIIVDEIVDQWEAKGAFVTVVPTIYKVRAQVVYVPEVSKK